MVRHEISVHGVSPTGQTQSGPALLQMDYDDFSQRFLADLGALALTPGSSMTTLSTSPSSPVTLYQPVQRVVHVALMQVTCNSVGSPRLDPTRVESAGVVMRRVVRKRGVDDLHAPPAAWMRSASGQLQWVALTRSQELDDPDPTLRPQAQSGQPALDRLLATQSLSGARSEAFSPAFVAPPEVCDAAGRTFVFAALPTASSEMTTNARPTPQYDPGTLAASLPTLFQAGSHSAPMQDLQINYRFMSDDYAKANGGASFLTFSMALRLLYTVFGAFENTPQAAALVAALNRHNVYFQTVTNGVVALTPIGMGTFYQMAATALVDYDPASGQSIPWLSMPHAWDSFSDSEGAQILAAITASLQSRSSRVMTPVGRFQDASRLYRLRVFLRVSGHAPGCPTQLVWSHASDPFRIAAWHESAGRVPLPVPLPDPSDRNFLKNAKPNCSFSVPAGLMNAMQNTSLSGLSSGSGATGGGVQLDWICGFSIPLITICAFFVLNIFLSLLNLVFFWLPFIKTCIPVPVPTPSNTGDTDGT